MIRVKESSMKLKSAVFVLAACTLACGSSAAVPELKTEQDKTLYALGLLLSTNSHLDAFHLTESEVDLVKAGLADGALNRTAQVDLEEYGPKVNELAKARITAAIEETKKAGQAFIDKAVAEEDAKKTPSGMAIKTITEGTGESPAATDKVKVNYTGKLIDGTVFDSSAKHDGPASFNLNQVIPCWTEGFQTLKVGGKAVLYCPSDLAYGDRGRPGIPPGATLVFDVELLSIEKESK
jgi:FKBP-type peptidyl-prolyl cis-trans isomerase FkpA